MRIVKEAIGTSIISKFPPFPESKRRRKSKTATIQNLHNLALSSMSLNIKMNTYKISKLVKSSSGDKIRPVENKRRLAKKKNGGPGK